MKIHLSAPFDIHFKAAYLNVNKEPRRVVLLVAKNGEKTSTSYARYLMSVKLGRMLGSLEHVDHIDGNPMNDDVSNLQILSPSENNIKSVIQRGISGVLVKIKCPICDAIFFRPKKNVNYKVKNGNAPCCSRRCGGIKSAKSIISENKQ